MLTALLALQNMQGASYDIWSVNTDFDYHEEQRVETSHEVHPAVVDETIRHRDGSGAEEARRM